MIAQAWVKNGLCKILFKATFILKGRLCKLGLFFSSWHWLAGWVVITVIAKQARKLESFSCTIITSEFYSWFFINYCPPLYIQGWYLLESLSRTSESQKSPFVFSEVLSVSAEQSDNVVQVGRSELQQGGGAEGGHGGGAVLQLFPGQAGQGRRRGTPN